MIVTIHALCSDVDTMWCWKKMQEFPGPRIRQNFILKQVDNPNRLCDTINLRVKLRLVDKPEGQVSVGGQIITNLRYTNNTTLVARTSEELLELMKRVKAVSEQFKPYLKVEKTTIMIWSSSWSSGVVSQWLSRMVEALLISGDDWLRPRPRPLLQHFQNIWKDRNITWATKIRVTKALVFPTALYGCESQAVGKADSRAVSAFEMWCWRKLLGIS